MNETGMSELTVRQALPADVPALAEFLTPFVAVGRLLPRTHDELEILTKHGFIAEIGGRIAGFAALEIYSPKLGELRSLAVSPIYQGRGVGRAVVQAVIDRAREQNVFEVLAITSTEDFFRKCGFDFTLPGERKALFYQTRPSYLEKPGEVLAED
ncbi:N-acetylglutamate synthase [Planctopirus hydrillae]|nr:N-acetylglutamate synthase [Planctopirus hydrillae]